MACPWANGAKSSTLIAFESVYNTLPGDAGTKSVLLPINTNGVKCSQNSTTPNTIRGNRSPVEPIKGNNDVSGDVVVPVDYTAFGYWLKALFGAPASSAVSGKDGYYQHVFKIGDDAPSFTLEKAFPGISQYIRDSGCKASKMSISVGGDGELTSTISIMGAREGIEDASMSTQPVTAGFDRADNFKKKKKIGGTDVAVATSFSIDIDAGLDGDSYCIGNGGYRTAICEGLVNISGTMEAFFKDASFLKMAENDVETSMELTLAQGDLSLKIKLPEAKFAKTSPSIDGPTGVKQSLNYNAYYEDNSDNGAIVVTLVNKVASY